MTPLALITNDAPPYRIPLFELLAKELDCEIFLHGAELDQAELKDLPFPAKRLGSSLDAWSAVAGGGFSAVICGLSGRSRLATAYAATRRAHIPFVLWASLWAHPHTPFHSISAVPTRWLYRHADAVVTYGPHVTSYVGEYRGSTDGIFEATQAVDNAAFGRDISTEERQALREELEIGDRPLVLFVGRIVEEKGVRVLLGAWSQVRRRRDELLVLAGQGPLAEQAKAEPTVRVVGHLDREHLPVLYSLASMLILPSIKTRSFREPWGLVINEAMNQALPIVTTSEVGAAAAGLVRHEKNGLIVPQRSSGALVRAVEELLADDELRVRLGGQAKSDVGHYTYKRMAEGFKGAVSRVTCEPGDC